MASLTTGSVESTDGTRIAFEASGDGPAMVIVAGAMGYKAFPYLRKFAAEFARQFRVFAYDRRGRGDSGDTPPYSVAKEVDDLAAVCRAAGGQPIVLGISSGAALALEAAARGAPMSRLVAFEPPYMVDGYQRPEHTRYETEITNLIARDERDGAVKLFMRTVGVPAFFLLIMRIMPFWKHLRRVAHTLPYDAVIMNRFELPVARLSGIRVPTLVVGGGKSPAALQAAVRAVGQTVPGAEVAEIPGQSHAIKAAALLPVVARFSRTEPRERMP